MYIFSLSDPLCGDGAQRVELLKTFDREVEGNRNKATGQIWCCRMNHC